MRSLTSVLLAAIAFLLIPGRAAEPDPKAITYTLPDKIQWNKGANQDNAILQGDPSKPGLYVQLTKWHPGNMSRPHSHPNDRYITVLSGTWWMGTGPNYDPASTFPVKAGTYIVHHANELHYDGAKDEEAVLLIVGMGPANSAKGKAAK
jgi:quercetin dioxygenase-like cupin family protein